MSKLCQECGAPLSIGQGSAEVEIDSLKMEIERLRAESAQLEFAEHRLNTALGHAQADLEEMRQERDEEQIAKETYCGVSLRLLQERDEARAAATWLYANLDEAACFDIEGSSCDKWPWLEGKDMSDELFDALRDRVAKTNDGTWCSPSGLKAARYLDYFGDDDDPQADFVGLLMDEIERLRTELAKVISEGSRDMQVLIQQASNLPTPAEWEQAMGELRAMAAERDEARQAAGEMYRDTVNYETIHNAPAWLAKWPWLEEET